MIAGNYNKLEFCDLYIIILSSRNTYIRPDELFIMEFYSNIFDLEFSSPSIIGTGAPNNASISPYIYIIKEWGQCIGCNKDTIPNLIF